MKAEGMLLVQKVLAGETFSWQAKVTEQDCLCRYRQVEKYVLELYFDPLIRWCADPLIRWSAGPLVR